MLEPDNHIGSEHQDARRIQIKEWTNSSSRERSDWIAGEAPLSIQLQWQENNKRHRRDLAVTMRTPGADFELVRGFLYAEGVINQLKDIQQMRYLEHTSEIKGSSRVLVTLFEGIVPDLQQIERQFTAYASCGMCGKSSIDSIEIFCPYILKPGYPIWDAVTLQQLPATLLSAQLHFENTGGMHAAALFDLQGNILLTREDIGRHNAVDKLIGAAMEQFNMPLQNMGLLLSGRAGFELVQKALVAGIPLVASIGAASSLAIDLAIEHGQTLVGFLRENRMIQYAGWNRIK